ncbi:MAG TPA: hypothetical protein PK626_03680 [Bacteroidales bacterium]|jgi:hypothetical protein|nr:hypothetical protein [Bacteroidales bacterium]
MIKIQEEDFMTIDEMLNIDVGEKLKDLNIDPEDRSLFHSALRREIALRLSYELEERGDVYLGMKTRDYILALKRFGFKEIYSLNFKSQISKRKETFYVLWHDELGILLECDSGDNRGLGNCIVGGNFYYNIKALDRNLLSNYMETGFFTEDDILIGKHNAELAVIYKIQSLQKFGDFVKPWVDKSLLMLVHHGDFNEKLTVEEITENRLNILPSYVQKIIKNS